MRVISAEIRRSNECKCKPGPHYPAMNILKRDTQWLKMHWKGLILQRFSKLTIFIEWIKLVKVTKLMEFTWFVKFTKFVKLPKFVKFTKHFFLKCYFFWRENSSVLKYDQKSLTNVIKSRRLIYESLGICGTSVWKKSKSHPLFMCLQTKVNGRK